MKRLICLVLLTMLCTGCKTILVFSVEKQFSIDQMRHPTLYTSPDAKVGIEYKIEKDWE